MLWVVDGARLAGHVRRGRGAAGACRRFDWHLGTRPAAVAAERRRQMTLCAVVAAVWVGMAAAVWAVA